VGYGEWVATVISQCLAGDDVLAVKGLAEDKFLGFFAFADGYVSLDYFVELVLKLLVLGGEVGLDGVHPVNIGLKDKVYCSDLKPRAYGAS
jgi:hypothetical protein